VIRHYTLFELTSTRASMRGHKDVYWFFSSYPPVMWTSFKEKLTI